MAGEKAPVRLPTRWQLARSVVPYLRRATVTLAGTIAATESTTGQRFMLYLPPRHSTGDDWPLLVHLHGAAARWSWVAKDLAWVAAQHERAVAAGIGEPMIIVAPHDPTRFSMWSDSADGQTKAATAILDDLVPYVESTYGARADRRWRVIQGFSMGGFGAAGLGLKHQDRFAAIVAWDGAFHDWETLNRSRPGIAANQFGGDRARFDEWSPWALAERADLSRTPILIVAGLLEDFAARFATHLAGLGADVTKLSTHCLHDLRCLQAEHGQRAFELIATTGSR